MKKLLFLLLFVCLHAENSELKQQEKNKMAVTWQEFTIGAFDDKIGLSLIGYTGNIKLNEMNNFYLSAGTSYIVHTISGGVKHYYSKSKLSIYSVFSFKKIFMDNDYSGRGAFNALTSSFSFEYNLLTWLQINLGVVGVLDDSEGSYDIWGYPFVSFNFKGKNRIINKIYN